MSRTGMHAAKLENSPRLQRIVAFLRLRGATGATGAELFRECGVLNPGTYASEINRQAQEFRIVCRYDGTAESGARVYRYTLIEGVVS